MLIQFFNKPFPFFQNKWHTVVLVALCVFTVLTIVQFFVAIPIKLHLFALFVGGYTAISAICPVILLYIFPTLFKRFFDEKRWTKGKYFVFAFILTSMIWIGNALYGYFLYLKFEYFKLNVEFPFIKLLYDNFLITFMIGVIPISFGYFWIKNRGLHSDLQEKEDQNKKLISRIQENDVADEKIITLSGNTKDSLTLFPRELLYMESSGNYVQIHYKINGQISQKTLRTTLQQMEELLNDYPFLVRCHRAFIVNTYQIEKMKGSKLWLKSTETKIPVSKTYKQKYSSQI